MFGELQLSLYLPSRDDEAGEIVSFFCENRREEMKKVRTRTEKQTKDEGIQGSVMDGE